MTGWPLITKTLRDYRGTVLAIGFVLFAIALLDVLLYPSYSDSLGDLELPPALEGFIGEYSLSSPEGFLGAEFFSWIPIVLVVLAVMAGTGAVAGEESAGTLDLLLAQPVRRSRLLAERFAGATVAIAITIACAVPGYLLALLFVDFPLSTWSFLRALIVLLPLTMLFLAFALWMGAALPTRSLAISATVGLVIVTYFLNLMGASVDALDTARRFTPFYWTEGGYLLTHGFPWLRVLGLLAVSAVFVALALVSFERRDVSSGAREWSLLRALGRLRKRADEEALAGRHVGPEPES